MGFSTVYATSEDVLEEKKYIVQHDITFSKKNFTENMLERTQQKKTIKNLVLHKELHTFRIKIIYLHEN
jgi:hypothetical protein